MVCSPWMFHSQHFLKSWLNPSLFCSSHLTGQQGFLPGSMAWEQPPARDRLRSACLPHLQELIPVKTPVTAKHTIVLRITKNKKSCPLISDTTLLRHPLSAHPGFSDVKMWHRFLLALRNCGTCLVNFIFPRFNSLFHLPTKTMKIIMVSVS